MNELLLLKRFGSAENLLDNPTAIVLDAPRHRLYVADARTLGCWVRTAQVVKCTDRVCRVFKGFEEQGSTSNPKP